jgi:ABC-type multidrug transport system ATPase subunit
LLFLPTGVNGAGKSTTMGILTGDIHPTSGAAYVDGKSLDDPKARLCFGYCPQTDPVRA